VFADKITSGPSLIERIDLFSISETCDIVTLNLRKEHDKAALKDGKYGAVVVADLGLLESNAESVLADTLSTLKPGGKFCALLKNIAPATVKAALGHTAFQTLVCPGNEYHFVVGNKSPPTDGVNGINGHSDRIVIVQPTQSTHFVTLISNIISSRLLDHGYEIEVYTWGTDVSTLSGKTCISLVELESSLLENLCARDFDSIKDLILRSGRAFWIAGFTGPTQP
jgi:zearalenone synthase (highly reducing iterative type I polyketide synthase)